MAVVFPVTFEDFGMRETCTMYICTSLFMADFITPIPQRIVYIFFLIFI